LREYKVETAVGHAHREGDGNRERFNTEGTEEMRRGQRKTATRENRSGAENAEKGQVKTAHLKRKAGGRYKFYDNDKRAGGTPAYRQAGRRYESQRRDTRIVVVALRVSRRLWLEGAQEVQ
jgi:hypothetical protein